MMRSFIIITVLSALAACSVADLPSEEEMYTIVYDEKYPNGTIVSDAEFDSRFKSVIPLAEWRCRSPAISRRQQTVTVAYHGDPRDIITRTTFSQSGNPRISQTPLMRNSILITITSRSGVGIDSLVQIFT
ncbi:uncharacterized protein LOC111350961 isoform X1 [Spodoptera litura]|uniref:Uncharacterized protein LOC111350961 isoform X1 n=1 Tax=Spodoptera litura TaxID=69820 RepID=A0A9J7DUK8_SPOLT|nr:uncharacterized protein LOC111350961 isoform X1 [Spodoptera litura]